MTFNRILCFFGIHRLFTINQDLMGPWSCTCGKKTEAAMEWPRPPANYYFSRQWIIYKFLCVRLTSRLTFYGGEVEGRE